MRYKATFAIGFVTGYVLGSRAGRERYEQLKQMAKSILENPQVKHTTETMQTQANQLRTQATRKVQERAGAMSHDLREKVVNRLPSGLSDRLTHHTIDLEPQSDQQGGQQSEQPAYSDSARG